MIDEISVSDIGRAVLTPLIYKTLLFSAKLDQRNKMSKVFYIDLFIDQIMYLKSTSTEIS